jgi:hypothetical protein
MAALRHNVAPIDPQLYQAAVHPMRPAGQSLWEVKTRLARDWEAYELQAGALALEHKYHILADLLLPTEAEAFGSDPASAVGAAPAGVESAVGRAARFSRMLAALLAFCDRRPGSPRAPSPAPASPQAFAQTGQIFAAPPAALPAPVSSASHRQSGGLSVHGDGGILAADGGPTLAEVSCPMPYAPRPVPTPQPSPMSTASPSSGAWRQPLEGGNQPAAMQGGGPTLAGRAGASCAGKPAPPGKLNKCVGCRHGRVYIYRATGDAAGDRAHNTKETRRRRAKGVCLLCVEGCARSPDGDFPPWDQCRVHGPGTDPASWPMQACHY